jgi:hypothetical protein
MEPGVKNPRKSASVRSEFIVLRQICHLIPNHLVPKLTRELGAEALCRTFSAWSHTVSLLFAQLTGALGLNDVCDSLRLHSGPLSAVRGATPPSRNNLSHANKRRPAALAEKLFWSVLAHLQSQSPGFAQGRKGRRLAARFRKTIHVIDATTIHLIASCMDWAKHRRRKAAAKCHLRLDLRSQLPRFAIIGPASENDVRRARELCAGIREGEIALFDRGYVDFAHLFELQQRGVFWVTRAKEHFAYKVIKRRQQKRAGQILRDEEVALVGSLSKKKHPARMRRVEAEVLVDGKLRVMIFLTNNLEWAPSSVAELYRCRWQIEVFFKQIKQTLQVSDFLGNSSNAVSWQLWTAMLCYVLLRYLAFLGRWTGSFTRLWAVLRSTLWQRLDLRALLESCGTAGGSFRVFGQPEQAWFPGLGPKAVG